VQARLTKTQSTCTLTRLAVLFSSLLLVAVFTPLTLCAQQASNLNNLLFHVSAQNEVIQLHTRLRVPERPASQGTLFLWPGLQPYGRNFQPIDNGVLQPVLTWGKSCAPGEQPALYSTWWVSAQYVNTYGHEPGYTGCLGGSVMAVRPGEILNELMWLDGTKWHQVVTNESTGEHVDFVIDMKGQAQTEIIFEIESWASASIDDVEFLGTEFTMRNPEPNACLPLKPNSAEVVFGISANPQGTVCHIDRIVLSLHTVAPADVSPAACKDQMHLKSLDATTHIQIDFRNSSKTPVSVYWLDYNGKPQIYNVLGVNQPLQIFTYTTHPWMITSPDGSCLGIYVATPGASKFEIK